MWTIFQLNNDAIVFLELNSACIIEHCIPVCHNLYCVKHYRNKGDLIVTSGSDNTFKSL